ncbi:reverse transcriptase domain-containing protein [Tanacetum coccineum]
MRIVIKPVVVTTQFRQTSVGIINLEKTLIISHSYDGDNRTMAQCSKLHRVVTEDAIVISESRGYTLRSELFYLKSSDMARKEPPGRLKTWDHLVSKFINKFFPSSKTTNLRNEITRFQQKFDETFYEAWDRFNDLLRGCPHHGQNASRNVKNHLRASPRYVNKEQDLVRALILDRKKPNPPASAPLKADLNKLCNLWGETFDGLKANSTSLVFSIQNPNVISQKISIEEKHVQSKTEETISTKGRLEKVSLPEVVLPAKDRKQLNHDAEVTKDTMPPANNGSTKDVQPPVVQIQSRNPNPEPNVALVVAPVVTPIPKASIPFPLRRMMKGQGKAND